MPSNGKMHDALVCGPTYERIINVREIARQNHKRLLRKLPKKLRESSPKRSVIVSSETLNSTYSVTHDDHLQHILHYRQAILLFYELSINFRLV